MSTTGRPYAVLNFVGSGLLAGVAASEELWAFVVLNTVWALVSLRRVVKPLTNPEEE
jgi:hypothetical protein